MTEGDTRILLPFGKGKYYSVSLADPEEGDSVVLLPLGRDGKYVAVPIVNPPEGEKAALVSLGKGKYVAVGILEVPCVNVVLNPCLSSSSNWTPTVYVGTVTFGVAGGAGGCGTHAHLTIISHPYGGFKVAQISQTLTPPPLGRYSFWYRFWKEAGSDYQLQSIPPSPTETFPEASDWTQIQRNTNSTSITFTLGGYTPNKSAWADITAVCLC